MLAPREKGVDVQVLTARERAVVAAIAEAFFPSRGAIGVDAAAAGVVAYVDTFLARLGRPQRLQLRALLLLFEVGTAAGRRGVRFSAAPLGERVARLESWEQADRYHQRAAFAALRWLFTLAYVANPDVQRRIGVPAPVPRPPAPVRRSADRRRLRGLARRRRRAGTRVARIERSLSTEQLITGIELADWTRMLARARWRVSARYLHRAAWITAWSVGAGAVGRVERARHGRRIAKARSTRRRSSSSATGAAARRTSTTCWAATRTTRSPPSTASCSRPRSC